MLFSAPAFAFLFLPLSLAVFSVFAKSRKKIWLFAVCVIYQALLWLSAPINLLYLPALCLYTFSVRLLMDRNCPKALLLTLKALPFVALVVLRYLAYLEVTGFVYPVGLTIPVLCSLSFISDSQKYEKCPADLFSLASYLYFFPTMLVGPVVRYRDFCGFTSDEQMILDLANTADGVRIYIIGFVKRIAVGAVLVDGYKSIFAYSWEAPSFVLVALMIILIYFGVFFSVWGYYDMGVGVARMFGVKVPEVRNASVFAVSVSEYAKGLFGSFKEWIDEYVIYPIYQRKQPKRERAVRISVYTLFSVLVARCELHMLVLVLPLFVFSLLIDKLGVDRHAASAKRKRVGLRIISCIVCVFVIGFVWLFVTLGSAQGTVLGYIGEVSFGNAEYQTDMVLLSFSGAKYIFVVFLGLLTVLPFTRPVARISEKMTGKLGKLREYVSMAVLLLMFVFTATFFLPQFDIYNYSPFDFIIM